RSHDRARIPQQFQYRPQLLALEERLPPGDVVLGAGLAGSLLGPSLLTLDNGLAAGDWVIAQAPEPGPRILQTTAAPATWASPGLREDGLQTHVTMATGARPGGSATPTPEPVSLPQRDATFLDAVAAAPARFAPQTPSRTLAWARGMAN